jgi:cell division transport system ATP-binding protein
MIQLYHVTKNYEGVVPALVDVSLKIEKGEFVFITGSSGAGKSTLLKLIFGAESPTDGHIILDGRNYQRIPAAQIPYLRRRMGFVFQDFKLITRRSVFENVALSLKIFGLRPVDVKKRALRALSYVRLQHRSNFMPLSLSGGEQQRVAVARALVKEPAILLADEPTGNLDPALALEMMELFKEVNNKGTTVVIATHDSAVLSRLNKRVITLDTGRVVG